MQLRLMISKDCLKQNYQIIFINNKKTAASALTVKRRIISQKNVYLNIMIS